MRDRIDTRISGRCLHRTVEMWLVRIDIRTQWGIAMAGINDGTGVCLEGRISVGCVAIDRAGFIMKRSLATSHPRQNMASRIVSCRSRRERYKVTRRASCISVWRVHRRRAATVHYENRSWSSDLRQTGLRVMRRFWRGSAHGGGW